VNYRRFNQEYTNFVLGQNRNAQRKKLTLPIVRMAECEVRIIAGEAETSQAQNKVDPGNSLSPELQARRWNDYGIALLEQTQYGPAAQAFRRASRLHPKDPNPLVSAAIAEMRTERFGPDREQLFKAAQLLDAALKLDPTNARSRFFYALVLRGQRKTGHAAEELRKLALEYPRDREVARQLGQTLYVLGSIAEARLAFEAILTVDPTDFGAYQFLAPIYQSEGQTEKAEYVRSLFLQWRDDPLASSVATRFFAAHPQWADERVLSHVHDGDSALRPVLTGLLVAPER
jgi:Flp pilus assembly protein TadD